MSNDGIRGGRAVARATALAACAASPLLLQPSPAIAVTTWISGARNNDATVPFAAWRGTSLGVVSGWINWQDGWAGMNAYAGGSSPRTLRRKASNVSFGHGLFPPGGTLASCAKGAYDSQHREVARLLDKNGVGDAEIRLGWEANGNWFPWTAVGHPAADWRDCFTRVAKAMKATAPKLRICWSMAKKGRVDVRTLWPKDAPITNICLSHYDDAYDRFGNETYLGGPWGLRAWLAYARSNKRKLAFGEWGVGRAGDNPQYIQQMYDFLKEAGNDIAHEAYFNTGLYQLYPVGPNPRSSALYKQLF